MRTTCRFAKGQGLVEGVVGLWLFVTVFVMCLILFINTMILGAAQQKLTLAATAAAQCINDQKYWLGMGRDDYNETNARANAKAVADSMLGTLGLPATSSFEPSEVKVGNLSYTRVTLGVDKIPLAGGYLPVGLKASSAAYNQGTRPWRSVHIHFQQAGSPHYVSASFPAFSVTTQSGVANGIMPAVRAPHGNTSEKSSDFIVTSRAVSTVTQRDFENGGAVTSLP